MIKHTTLGTNILMHYRDYLCKYTTTAFPVWLSASLLPFCAVEVRLNLNLHPHFNLRDNAMTALLTRPIMESQKAATPKAVASLPPSSPYLFKTVKNTKEQEYRQALVQSIIWLYETHRVIFEVGGLFLVGYFFRLLLVPDTCTALKSIISRFFFFTKRGGDGLLYCCCC